MGRATLVSGGDRSVPGDAGVIVDPDGVELRRVPPDQIDDEMAAEMIALFRAAFPRWPALEVGVPALDHLRWKTTGPQTRVVGSVQARADGRLALATTSWATWFRIGGERRLRIVYTDVATHPDYRGRGLYSRSVKYRAQLVGDRFDVSLHERGASPPHHRGPLARKGQAPVANVVTRRYRVLRPRSFSVGLERPWLAPIAAAIAGIGNLRAASNAGALRGRDLWPHEEERFDDRFERLFEQAAPDFDLIGERTLDFLRWRFGDRRAGPFSVRAVGDGDRLLGYAVLRLHGVLAYVADLLAVPGRTDVVEALLADAVQIARAGGASGVECWLSGGHPYRRALARQGFVDSRRDVGLQFHPVTATAYDLRCLRDPRARVHYQLGDTDLV